ncbi:DUF4221 family protein [Belliella kenyensis]|uniref:DUF4221 family protein n=1 Tax=Belliella kenyensis TaxID=1472724 RepID=A0ABV8EJM4_9BACT|nr:DUF4221 family protein [Belliella kenyensis]MCH7402328.1 DUF4221 domain-containing protein [Belliella kenyensis]MDN3603519.1 DUF4221 family protein [Belliella kenyensis]
MKILIFTISLVLLFSIGCGSKISEDSDSNQKNESFEYLKYKLDYKFTITLKETSTYSSNLQVYEKDDEELLLFADAKNNGRIFFFNINNGALVDKIEFELEGPNGIGRMNGFHYINEDTILIVNSFQYKVLHLNSTGSIIDRFDLKSPNGSLSILPHPTSKSVSGMIGDQLYIKGVGEKNPYEKDYYNEMKVTQKLDLQNRSVNSGIGFPEKYRNNYFHLSTAIEFFQDVKHNYIYQSFPSEEEVYVYDKDFSLIKSFGVNHRLVKPLGKVKESDVNSDNGYKMLYSNGKYTGVYVDLYKKYLYRAAVIPPINPDQFSNYKEIKDNVRQGLVIYDLENDKKIGEVIFEINEVDLFPMYFIAKEGLYVSKEDPDENVVHFYLLRF